MGHPRKKNLEVKMIAMAGLSVFSNDPYGNSTRCKGGNLALVPERAEQLMKAYNPAASVPSWAIRFAASQEGVMMVLSGMNTLEQMLDNTSYMADFKPLSKEEDKIIGQVIEIINETQPFPAIFQASSFTI